jgi:hypothetical protein
MKTKITPLLFTILLLFALTGSAAAQEDQPTLEINLSRDFGYGGFGNDIQGTFTIKVSGPDELTQVQFYIDEEMIGSDSGSPYALQFNTGNFDPGEHKIYAVGVLADGGEIRSRELVQEFLSDDDAMRRTLNIVGPILGITLLAILLGSVLPALRGRKGGVQAIGEYSAAGGTVCPRCGFPFSRNMLSPNLAFGKLERCPHCGKWSIRARASQADLAAAEDRLRASRQETGGEIEIDERDELQRALDDSKFDD